MEVQVKFFPLSCSDCNETLEVSYVLSASDDKEALIQGTRCGAMKP